MDYTLTTTGAGAKCSRAAKVAYVNGLYINDHKKAEDWINTWMVAYVNGLYINDHAGFQWATLPGRNCGIR